MVTRYRCSILSHAHEQQQVDMVMCVLSSKNVAEHRPKHLTSHPLLASLSQSVQPSKHLMLHLPFAHVAVATLLVRQLTLQEPQDVVLRRLACVHTQSAMHDTAVIVLLAPYDTCCALLAGLPVLTSIRFCFWLPALAHRSGCFGGEVFLLRHATDGTTPHTAGTQGPCPLHAVRYPGSLIHHERARYAGLGRSG